MGVRATATFEPEELKRYEEFAKKTGLKKVANLISVAVTEYVQVHANDQDLSRTGEVLLRLDNFDELNAYAKEKGLGNVASFAEFAMTRYKTQYPTKSEQGVPPDASEGKNKTSPDTVTTRRG